MREIKIRDAGEGDIEALAGLMTELGYPTSAEEMGQRFQEISADPAYDTLIAEQDGRVLGVAGFHVKPNKVGAALYLLRRCEASSGLVVGQPHLPHIHR